MKQLDLLAGHRGQYHQQVSCDSLNQNESGGGRCNDNDSCTREDKVKKDSNRPPATTSEQPKKNRTISRFFKLITVKIRTAKAKCLRQKTPSETSITSTDSTPEHQPVFGNEFNRNSQVPNQDKICAKDKLGKHEEVYPVHGEDVDSGYAWIILAVMFLINASTFGTARAYGLIFEKVARHKEQSRSYAALPFTIMGAVENMAGPLSSYLLTRSGSWRLTVLSGSCLITVSHLLAAFYDSLASQILFMGLMCGVGLSCVSISFFQINNAYFVRYRSRAFGLSLAGAAFGTFYISPLCKYILDNHDTKLCYLVLGLVLLPNVPLSLLLKPKHNPQPITSISKQVELIVDKKKPVAANNRTSAYKNIRLVLKSRAFHLIWPTQLIFCWFNFVFGMIINDFGLDRGLNRSQGAQLINIWAFGQLAGRLVVSSLIDLKFLSYRLFTVICFASIGVTIWTLNNVQSQLHQSLLISVLVFILSIFISNLYILFNGLVFHYMDRSLTAHSIGISSFIGSFFLLPRAYIIGHYRDTTGSYDAMLSMFTYTASMAAFVGLLLPPFYTRLESWWLKRAQQRKRTKLRTNLLNNVLIGSGNVHQAALGISISSKPSVQATHSYTCSSQAKV